MIGDVCFTFAEFMDLKQSIFNLNASLLSAGLVVGFVIAKIPDAIKWYQERYGAK